MKISDKERRDRGVWQSGEKGADRLPTRGVGDTERGAGRRATDDGNPGALVGTESRQGVWYARYRAKQGTWVSSSLAQLGYDKEYGRDVAYGAYLGIVRAPNGQPLETPDKIRPGQEYLIPIGTAGKLTIPRSASENLPPSGLRPNPIEPERGTQPVRPRVFSGPRLPPWVKPEQEEAIRELARRREVRSLQSKRGQPTGASKGPDRSDSDWTEYHYHRDVLLGNLAQHPSSTIPLDQLVMSALQADPNRFFPFNVIPLHGEHGIELNGEYNLDASIFKLNRSYLPPGGPFPVRVTEVGPRSFTFTTLGGHFDEPGSTIRFSTYLDGAGNIHFVHDADTKQSASARVTNLVAPFGVDYVWGTQEDNLRSWLRDIP